MNYLIEWLRNIINMATTFRFNKYGIDAIVTVSNKPSVKIREAFPIPDYSSVVEASYMILSLHSLESSGKLGIKVASHPSGLPGTNTTIWNLYHCEYQGTAPLIKQYSVLPVIIYFSKFEYILSEPLAEATHEFYLESNDGGILKTYTIDTINTPKDVIVDITHALNDIDRITPFEKREYKKKYEAYKSSYNDAIAQSNELVVDNTALTLTWNEINSFLNALTNTGGWNSTSKDWNSYLISYDLTVGQGSVFNQKWEDVYAQLLDIIKNIGIARQTKAKDDAISFDRSQTWTTPGNYNFTVPPGVHFITALATAGGGAGGAGNASFTGGGAGGGAGFKYTLKVNPGDIIPLKVGTGGTGGTGNGNDGTTSYVEVSGYAYTAYPGLGGKSVANGRLGGNGGTDALGHAGALGGGAATKGGNSIGYACFRGTTTGGGGGGGGNTAGATNPTHGGFTPDAQIYDNIGLDSFSLGGYGAADSSTIGHGGNGGYLNANGSNGNNGAVTITW